LIKDYELQAVWPNFEKYNYLEVIVLDWEELN
jgi:hypothetical protein